MRNLRTIRIFLAIIFFVAAVAFLCIGPQVHPMAKVAESVQIIPSAISVTLGATIFWLIATFFLGRVYCSTVCPVGTLQDAALWVRNKLSRGKPKKFRYKDASKWRYHILAVYMICLIIGLVGIPYLIEPWNIMRNMAAAVRPSDLQYTWDTLWVGATTGIVAGLVSFVLLIIAGAFFGRDFCNVVCPIGNALGLMSNYTMMHIEIDPDKCTGCLKCEEVCRGSCIKVVGRHVDNSRCIRCFDCLKVCDDDAIRFQTNKNRAATPLMRKKTRNA